MNDIIEVESENGITSVRFDSIPDIIAEKIDSITVLKNEIERSKYSANNAMVYVNHTMKGYQEKGKGIFRWRSGSTKDIIEDTQTAIENLTNAQQASVSALTKSFEFQKKLAEISSYLFKLGCANITVNRLVVHEIEEKLKDADNEKMSDFAKHEMLSLVRQLKEQEDVFKKQEFLSSKVKETISRLDKKDVLDKNQSENINLLKDENKKQEKKLTELHNSLSEKERIDNEQTQRIASLSNENKKQSKRLTELHESLSEKERIDNEQTQRLEELTSLLDNKGLIDQKQEEAISKNAEAIKILFEYTKQKDALDKKQSAAIERIKVVTQRKLCVAAIIISGLALICSVVSIITCLSVFNG